LPRRRLLKMNAGYERIKKQARRASALRSLAGREISPLPPVDDWTRRRKGVASLLEFCRLYFPEKFKKPFGKNHLALIDAFLCVISDGEKQAVAMPHGTEKTTIATAVVNSAIVENGCALVLSGVRMTFVEN